MAVGPGKYDPICSVVREATSAQGAIVLVLGGVFGSGFSVQGDATIMEKLPALLRTMADQIETDRNVIIIKEHKK